VDWLPYSIAATVLFGIAMSLYKLPSFKGYSSFLSTFWTNVFSAMLVVLALLFFSPEALGGFSYVSWYAIVWGAFFAVNMVLVKILLQDIEINSVYPVTSSLGSIATILVGIFVLSEQITIVQGIGIVVILSTVFLYTRKGGAYPLHRKVILLSLGIVFVSTVSKYIQKLGADHDTLSHFMIWQYIGAALFGILIAFIFENDKWKEVVDIKKYWKGSLLIGLFSALGGWMILKALSLGPLAMVYAIHPAYTFIAGIFGYLLFKEKLTKTKIILALLSVLGVVLIKLGQY